MKRIFIIMLTSAMLFSMFSCSDGGASAPATDSVDTDPVTDAQTDAQTDADTTYTPSRKIKIACVGDSLTYGVGASTPAMFSYPAHLQTMLGRKNYMVQNFGRSSSYMIDRAEYPSFNYGSAQSIAYKQTNEYQNSLNFKSDIVIICLGANDAYVSNTNTSEQVKYYYDSAVALAKQYQSLPSAPTVIFMYPPARFDAQYRNDYVKNTIIPQIDRAAAECGCEVIDIYSITENAAANRNTKIITSDGIHLTGDGYELVAKTVKEKIESYRLPEDAQ